MSLSDARRMYVLLRDAGADGCHSHQLRRQGVTGNPSQRAKDIVSHGVAISTRREAVGRRPGSRYWLAEHAPSDAVAVRANRDAEGGGGNPMGSVGTEKPAMRIEPESQYSEFPPCGVCGGPVEHSNGLWVCVARCCLPKEQLNITPAPEQVAIREPVAVVRDGDSFAEVPVRPCRRCESTGQLAGGECPACFGTGVIARTRVNSYVDPEQRAA